MRTLKKILLVTLAVLVVGGLILWWLARPETAELTLAQTTGPRPTIAEGDAETIPTFYTANPIGWRRGQAPKAAAGFLVTAFASGLDHPRTITTLPNGDVLVTETNRPP